MMDIFKVLISHVSRAERKGHLLQVLSWSGGSRKIPAAAATTQLCQWHCSNGSCSWVPGCFVNASGVYEYLCFEL